MDGWQSGTEHEWQEFSSGDKLAAWRRLADEACEPNPFLESWYLLPSLENFDPAGKCRLFTTSTDNQLTGLLPVEYCQQYSRYPIPHLANWRHPNMFCSVPLVSKGHEEEFWQGLLDWADANAKAALFLHLTDLPADGQLFAALQAVIARQDRAAAVVMDEERAMLKSDHSPEDYFATSMSSKKRKELRRQAKRLSEEGDLTFSRQSDASKLEQWIDEFLALEQGGWKGAQGSALACDPYTSSMFHAVLTGAARQGKLERLALRLDGKPIAMLVNFLTAPGAYSFKTAFDEAWSRYSPGVLIQRENLDLLARDDIAWCDSCAAADHPMIERIWREKRRIVRVSIAIGGPLRRMIFQQLARKETGAPAKGL